jgi:putative ABC transport system ATP-binding protein
MAQVAIAPAGVAAAFRVAGLEKVYGEGDTAVDALRGLDLVVPRSAFIVPPHPSDSGTSTLLNINGGLDRGSRDSPKLRAASVSSGMSGSNRRNLSRARAPFDFTRVSGPPISA